MQVLTRRKAEISKHEEVLEALNLNISFYICAWLQVASMSLGDLWESEWGNLTSSHYPNCLTYMKKPK